MKIEEVVDKIEKLKPFSMTYMKIKKMLNDPYVSAKKIVDVIKYDQSFTANILKICNSALYRRSKRIKNLIQAVSLIGSNQLKQIVLIESVNQIMSENYKGYEVYENELWNHSVITGLISEQIGKQMDFKDLDTLFTASILHDVGKVILSSYVHDNYQDIISLVDNENYDFLQAEKEVLGFNHSEVGGKILESWQFPPVLIDAVRYHHNPEKFPDNTLIQIVYIADLIAIIIGSTTQRDGLAYNANPKIARNLDLKINHIHKTIANVTEKIGDVQEMVS